MRGAYSNVLYFVMAAVFALDQLFKWLIRSTMAVGESTPIIPHAVYFLYIRNPGGAFSILPNFRWLFIAVAIAVIVAGIVVNQRYRPGLWSTIALGLVLGGALGNMADRAATGLVTDYVYLSFINFPVFNLADASIDVGIALWIVRSLMADRTRRNEEVTMDERTDEHSR